MGEEQGGGHNQHFRISAFFAGRQRQTRAQPEASQSRVSCCRTPVSLQAGDSGCRHCSLIHFPPWWHLLGWDRALSAVAFPDPAPFSHSARFTVSSPLLLPSLSVSYRLSPSPSSRAVANQFPPHQFQCYLRRAAATERFQCSFRAFSEHFQGSFRAVSGQFQSTFESSFQLSSKTSFNCLHPSFRTVSEQFQSKIQPPLSPGFERYPLGFWSISEQIKNSLSSHLFHFPPSYFRAVPLG